MHRHLIDLLFDTALFDTALFRERNAITLDKHIITLHNTLLEMNAPVIIMPSYNHTTLLLNMIVTKKGGMFSLIHANFVTFHFYTEQLATLLRYMN